MSKRDGAIFSKSLFGYKKCDVNEYIRLADESSSEKIKEYEARIKELEETLLSERTIHQAEINKLSDELGSAAKNAELAKREFDKKLTEAEERCATYIKLADNASSRAEASELRVTELSCDIERQKEEITTLKGKIDEDTNQIIQLSAEISRLSAIEQKEKTSKVRFFKLRRPSFLKIVKK